MAQEPNQAAVATASPPIPPGVVIPADIFRTWLKWARILGILPLVAGVLLSLAWLATRNELLELLGGVIVIPLGCLCLLCGLISLVVYVILSRRDAQGPPIQWAVVGTLGLFAANLLLAMGAISGAQAIKGMSSVTVVNLGEKPLTSVRLLLAGKVIPLKDVPPGGTVTRSFVVNRSGDIYIEGMQGADKVSGSVGRASNEAMKLTLTLDSGGEFHVVSNAVPGEN